MKILHITNSLKTGGAEKLVAETLPLLNQMEGLKADLLLLCGSEEPFLHKLQALDCCTIFSLSEKKIYNPFFIFKIIPFLRKYDIIHVHLFPSLYWAGLAKMVAFSKVKMVYTEHSTTNKRRGKFFFRLFDRLIYKSYNKIVAISSEVESNLREHLGYNPNRFVEIPNGVNIAAIQREKIIEKPHIHSKINDESFIILQVSSFRYPKDQKTVIKALPYLSKNTFLIFVGSGPLKEECENLAAEMNLSERVIFLGIRTDVFSLIKSVDVIVLSSHYEGVSLASIEGMASGKPFIATDAPGLAGIVRNAGILFPKGDSYDLAQKILHLQNNKPHYLNTVEKCMARAKKYDLMNNVKKTIKLYSEELNS